MKEERLAKAEKIQRIAFVLYCFLCGGVMIAISITGNAASRYLIGSLFLLASVFHALEFHKHFDKLPTRLIYGLLFLAGIVFGILTLVLKKASLDHVCLVFGIMDVSSGLLEIFANSVILKKSVKSPINFTEYAISVADIIFGTLLIIEGDEGVLVHILYLSVVFIVNGIISLLETIKDLEVDE